MIALVAALALAQQTPPAPLPRPRLDYSRTTDAQFCAILRQIREGLVPDLPRMVDATMRLDGMTVRCRLRTVATNHHILTNMSEMQEGWQTRRQEQWNGIICQNPAFAAMVRRGWRFRHHMTFQSGERVTQDARC